MSARQSWHSVGSYRFSPLDRYRYRIGSVLDRTKVFNIGSVLQGSTNRCNRYRRTIRTDRCWIGIFACQNRTDRENCPIYRTEPILIAAGPQMRLQGAPRANTYHARECVPWGRMRTTRQCVSCMRMRTTRKWVPWGRMHNTTRECLPRAKYPSVEQFM